MQGVTNAAPPSGGGVIYAGSVGQNTTFPKPAKAVVLSESSSAGEPVYVLILFPGDTVKHYALSEAGTTLTINAIPAGVTRVIAFA